VSEFWQWAGEHYFLATIVALSLLSAVRFIIWRTIRVIGVVARGWPTAHLMDADGDIVHPKAKD